MGMQLRTFEWVSAEHDRNLQWSGWRMIGMDHFDPCESPLVLVHDSIEHFQKNESGLDRECMAFGSIIHIRHRGGYWNATPYTINSMIMLQKELIEFMINEDFDIKPCKEPLHSLFDDTLLSLPEFEDHCSHWDKTELNKNYQAFITGMRWVSLGIKAAEKRWSNHSSNVLCMFFKSMEKRLTHSILWHHSEQGNRLEIRVNPKTLHCSIRLRTIDGWHHL